MREIRFGVIGAGLMGREFASATLRFEHLTGLDFRPRIAAVCDSNPSMLEWFVRALPGAKTASDWRALLDDRAIDALYVALPHHLHEEVYCAAIDAGKPFMGEKPFGIDRAANSRILAKLATRKELFVRCSSELPFYPGGQRIAKLARERAFGRVLEVRSGLLHSSDLDPNKPINWKRQAKTNGELGCLSDLGMHALHLPLRLGFAPRDVRALLTKVVEQRPDATGRMVSCDTWDNALLACMAGRGRADEFPLLFETKRIAPGHKNTWFLEVQGTRLSASFTTKEPRTLRTLPYSPGGPQAWHVEDLGWESAYPGIGAAIFEFGFSDAILQMWAAWCDEFVHGRAGMRQPFYCATPEETRRQHEIFAAALESQRTGRTVPLELANSTE